MNRNPLLQEKRIVADELFHRPFDVDGNGITLVCDLSAKDVRYSDIRRFSWLDLQDSTKTTCLGCLAAGYGDEADELAFATFSKVLGVP